VDPIRAAPLTGVERLFLTDLGQGVGETRNLVGEAPDTARRLRRLHEKWVEDVTLRDKGCPSGFLVTLLPPKNWAENTRKDFL